MHLSGIVMKFTIKALVHMHMHPTVALGLPQVMYWPTASSRVNEAAD